MSFCDELYKITGGIAPLSYRITILSDGGLFIEGVSKLLDIKSGKLNVLCGKSTVFIEGENLKICSYVEKDLYVVGKINKVERK